MQRRNMKIKYTDILEGISSEQLTGFFEGWQCHPGVDRHLEILRASYRVWLTMDGTKCVGFINAISDGLFSAFIPLLEVLPEYRGNGIGSELVRRMAASLDDLYSIDIVCDNTVAKFYEAQGFSRLVAMAKRNYNYHNTGR
jgi:ribosomal protein S18 acetylase RimI-like enzyme